MGRKLANIKMQLHKRVDNLLQIGQSRHIAKHEYRKYCEENNVPWKQGQTVGIHSPAQADSCRRVANGFGDWLKANHKEIKTLDQIDKKVAYDYLRSRENLSAYTVTSDMTNMNKLLRLDLTKKEGGLREKNINDITRSRTSAKMDAKYNPSNYKDQIEFSKAFGTRRESILGGKYQVKDISLYQKNNQLYVRVIEKGGRYREAPCLAKYQDEIIKKYNVQEGEKMTKSEFEKHYKTSDEYLFDKYTRHIDNHAFRGEYSRDYYSQLCEIKISKGETVKSDYRGFDKELVQEVSHALGHNRLDVVINHYFR